MVRKVIVIILLLGLILTSGVLAQGRIFHNPPQKAEAGKPLAIQALVEGNVVSIQNVYLFFRNSGNTNYTQLEMQEKLGVYYGEIPGNFVQKPGIEYFIEAELVDGGSIAFPAVDPFNVPIFIRVEDYGSSQQAGEATSSGAQEKMESGALILSPEQGELVSPEQLIIAISLFNVPGIDLGSIKIMINGEDYTSQANIEEDIVTLRPSGITPGVKTVVVSLKNRYGVEYKPLSWSFRVARSEAEVERMLTYNGRIQAEARSEQIRGISDHLERLTASFNGSYDWLNFGANLVLTTRESPDYQPRNRYSFQVKTSYFDLYLGDVYPRISPFEISGKRIRGMEFNLKLKYINFNFVKGTSERSIRGSFNVDSLGYTDPETGESLPLYRRTGYTFERNITAGRLYFGSGKKAQFGLSLLKARDDTTSVSKVISGIPDDISSGRVELAGSTPEDNIVFGMDFRLALDEKRIVWENFLGISWWNRDIGQGAISKAELDTLAPGDSLLDGKLTFEDFSQDLDKIPDPKDYADWFIIGRKMVPFLPLAPDSNGNWNLRDVLNLSSGAYKSILKLNYYNNYIIFRYQHVGPEFKTLGNPYQRIDIQGFSISDKIRLFNNRVFVTLSYENFRDNLLNNKPATTSTNAFSAGLTLYPGEGLPTLNFSTLHYGRANDATQVDVSSQSDPRENNITLRQNLSISHTVEILGLRNDININYSNTTKTDQITRESWYTPIGIKSSVIQAALATTFPFKLKSILSLNINSSTAEAIRIKNDLLAGGVELKYRMLDSRLIVNGGGKVSFGTQPVSTGSIDPNTNFPIFVKANFIQNNFFLGFSFQFLKNHLLTFRADYNFLNDQYYDTAYNDYIAYLRYSYRF